MNASLTYKFMVLFIMSQIFNVIQMHSNVIIGATGLRSCIEYCLVGTTIGLKLRPTSWLLKSMFYMILPIIRCKVLIECPLQDLTWYFPPTVLWIQCILKYYSSHIQYCLLHTITYKREVCGFRGGISLKKSWLQI